MKKVKKLKSLKNTDVVNEKTMLGFSLKWIFCFVSLFGLGCLLAYILFAKQYHVNKDTNIQQYADKQVQLISKSLSRYFKDLDDDLSFTLKENKNLRQSIDEFIEKNKLSKIKPIDARFFKTGSAKLDLTGSPTIRFADLDLIRRAEKGEKLSSEFRLLDEQILLAHVQAVPSSLPQGVIFSVVDVSDIKTLVESAAKGGFVKLIQKIDERSSRPILTAGLIEKGSVLETNKKQALVADTLLSVEFTPNSAVDQFIYINVLSMAWLPILIMIISLALSFFVSQKIFRSKAVPLNNKEGVPDVKLQADINKKSRDQYDFVDPMYQAKDILDIEINPEDEALIRLEDVDPETHEDNSADVLDIREAQKEALAEKIPQNVFRAYDIRGLAFEEIDKEFAQLLGQALGSEALEYRETCIIVARDARNHSPQFMEWLTRGILSSGCDVINIGTVPTPLMYFATETLEQTSSGVIVTASHNPKEYNGFKIVINGKIRSADDIQALRERMLSEDLSEGVGKEERIDVVPNYIDTIFSDVALAGDVTVVVDAANAVPGTIAPRLLEELGCQVVPVYCDLDGSFPNHSPDPTNAENLKDLINLVQDSQADLGLAFDGDGDRLAVVTASGKIISTDQLILLFAKDIISRNPGADVIYDVKSSRLLNSAVSSFGGRPIMCKTGHSFMKEKMQETQALLGGEYSGHIFIKDRWYGFDDGLYAATRLLEILTLSGQSLDELISEFELPLSTPEIRVPYDDDKKFTFIENLIENSDFAEGKITALDGIRVDFASGWGLVRASNTSPELTLRFEADNEKELHKIKSLFTQEMKKVDSKLMIDWTTY